jgi:hypothetical protein
LHLASRLQDVIDLASSGASVEISRSRKPEPR